MTRFFSRCLTLVVFTFLVASCASPSKKECEQMRWADLGAEQGEKGSEAKKKLSELNKSCGERHGVSVDRNEFMNGYKLGLGKYCTWNKGKEMGEIAMQLEIPLVCEGELSAVMKAGYKAGLAKHCKPERFSSDGAEGKSFEYSSLCDKSQVKKAKAAYLRGLNAHCKLKMQRLGRKGRQIEFTGACEVAKKELMKSSYQKGLAVYCTSENGYKEGLAGHSYRFVCKGPMEPAFLRSYNLGAQQKSRLDIARMRTELSILREESERKDAEITRLSNRVDNLQYDVSDKERQIRDLQDELEEVEKKNQRSF